MLTEDAVVERTCGALRDLGFEIETQATASQHGPDIVAIRDSLRVVIEAKGAGSSKPGTARYGQEFNSGQVFDHVAKAVLKALREVSAGHHVGGIALPDNAAHRREVGLVRDALIRVGVVTVWVGSLGVEFDPPNWAGVQPPV